MRLELQYDSIEEFLNKCMMIKKYYGDLTKESKKIYKLYVYAKRHIREFYCDLMWLYLNDEPYENIILSEDILKEIIGKNKVI